VNWNGWSDTAACLRSLADLEDPTAFRVVVVDNGSTDDSVERLRAEFPDVTLTETGKNLGFAGANNVAIAEALRQDFDFVWLLNNDTTVAPDALTQLVKALDECPKAGVAGSKIYFFDRPDVLWYAGGGFTASGLSKHRGVGERDTGQFEHLESTGYVTGCSLLARTVAIKDAGLMDEAYFLYWEEADWEDRMAKAGWIALYVPLSKVWHKVSASTSGLRSWLALRYEVRNRIRYYSHRSRWRTSSIALVSLAQAAKHALRGRFGLAGAILAGLADGVAGRSGQIPAGG
jgi:GT2 family glycosyltransferase